jgi:ketosteroid isomerase-like protein
MNAADAGMMAQALALLDRPAALPAARVARFPHDITALIRVVAGDAVTIERAAAATGESEAVLREAAEFFLLQVCFTPGIDSYRVLAANRDDATSRIREHYRLLVRWLHPDRNTDAWQTVFLDRVNRAWRDLRGSDERALYDRHVFPPADADAESPLVAGVPRAVIGIAPSRGSRFVSARTMRRLPALVLGGLGSVAASVLVLMYATRDRAAPLPGAPTAVLAETRAVDSTAAAATASPAAVLPVAAETDAIVDPVMSSGEEVAPVAAAAPGTETGAPAAVVASPAARTTRSGAVAAPPPVSPGDPPRAASVAAAPIALRGSPRVERAAATLAAAELLPRPAPVSVELPASDALSDQRSVDEVLRAFRSAYDEGDLIRLMALFTRDARNLAQGSRHLADEYRELFETSQQRRLSLHDMSWWREGDVVAVVATFDAAVTPIGRRAARRIGGDIRFELRQEDGAVRIARIRHQTQ